MVTCVDFKPCTPQEAVRLRRDLQTLGPAVFCQRTVDCGRYAAKKLITAFGVNPPSFLEGQPDEMYYDYLSLVMTRELAKRAKLMQHNTVDDVVDLIAKSQNIMVVTGAGISTSLGIPDFRSKGTGLYSKLEHLGLADPQEVFDIRTFREDPTIFYSVARDILPATTRFTPTHKFISMLHDRGKLLTNYTQNIDNLEMAAGIPRDKLIQCHGSFGTASCIDCKYQVQGDRIFDDIRSGRLPKCPHCATHLAARKKAAKRKPKKARWDDDDDDESDEEDQGPAEGIMKPDITFFGEELPDEFSHRLAEHDRDKVDLVIIIGTSLKVRPVSEIVNFLPPDIPQIYLSREAIQHTRFDVNLLGDCDVIIAELCRRLKWKLTHDMVPKDQVVRVKLQEGYVSRHQFEVVRPKQDDK